MLKHIFNKYYYLAFNNGFGIVFLKGTAYINKTSTYNLPIACNTLVPMITAHNLGAQSRYAEITQTTYHLLWH